MKEWYNKIVVPRLLASGMSKDSFLEMRQEVLKNVSGTVLEIGIGPGYNIPIYKNVSKLYALEPSLELAALAEKRAAEVSFPVEFIKVGAEAVPLLDNSIDTAVSTWTLCSVEDPLQVLREIKRVLKPEGRFVFIDHGASPNKFLYFLQKVSTPVSKHFTGNCHSDRKIGGLIKEVGFKIEKIEYSTEPWHPLIYNYQGIAVK